MSNLPVALRVEPLVDALFELRLEACPSIADVFSGILFEKLELSDPAERLSTADIPKQIREADPALKYAPTTRIKWDGFLISMSDKSLIVSCDLSKPYPKWPKFKEAIIKVVELLGKLRISGYVERFSIKYVNIIPANSLPEQLAKTKLDISLGPIRVTQDNVNLRLQRNEDGFIQILTIVTGARGQSETGKVVTGIVIDIDSIKQNLKIDLHSLPSSIQDDLENLKQSNKKMFFDCLTEEAIKEMGPEYA